MSARTKRIITAVAAVLFCVIWAALLLIPVGTAAGAGAEFYDCAWADGTVTREDYGQAYAALADGSSAEEIRLFRGGVSGTVATSDSFRAAYHALDTGGLNAVLSVATSDMVRLERAALWRAFRHRLWYSGELFRYTGEGVERVKTARGEELVLLSGGVTSDMLSSCGVKRLTVRAEAELTYRALVGTEIEEAEARPPYEVSDGALYADTVGGKRLIAGIPKAKSVIVRGNDFADRGALLPCVGLEELTLSFVGSAANAAGSGYSGMLAWLFSDGSEYYVPETLKRVKVTGGEIPEEAFYRCGGIEEIDLCGLDADKISSSAFSVCAGLQRLHAPISADLGEGFSLRILACGCRYYEKIQGGKD